MARTLDVSYTTVVSNSFLSPLEKNPLAADLAFNVIFFFILKIVYCVYLLESPLMRTHSIPSCYRKSKRSLL